MNPRNSLVRWGVVGTLSLVWLSLAVCQAADNSPHAKAPKIDVRYPFRTDFANAHLPWYQSKPGEFPPHHSDHRVGGELVSADFIHRTGQFRTSQTGELVNFRMPPYGTVNYLNAEADLRDAPLGTFFLFFLNQDAHGGFTQLAAMLDQYTIDAGHGFSYRLDEIKLAEGKLLTTKHSVPKNQPDLGKKELLITDETRVWNGDKQVALSDLAIGDELLFNLTGKTAQSPGRLTDLWVGRGTHLRTTEQQRNRHADFVKARGIPGWIDKTEGNKVTITLFSGDWHNFQKTYMGDIAVGKDVSLVVANDELRTWNPGTDKERSAVLDVQKFSVDCYGASGVRLIVSPANMLEGFRQGRVARIFAMGWPIKDQFYGESLMGYGYGRLQTAEIMELPPKEYPAQFPFRTDYGNERLPWYKIRPCELPPRFSEHLVFGELVTVEAEKRQGQFRTDRTAELVDFSLIPEGTIRYLNVDARLSGLPLGTRYRFFLYQDSSGAFTRASQISDEFSYLTSNAVTYRIETLKLAEGKLHVARQIPEVKNYNGDLERPPDIGRTELRVNADTRVWKGDRQVKPTDLAVGDALLVNLSGERPGHPSHCTEIWVGVDTHKLASEQETRRQKAAKK